MDLQWFVDVVQEAEGQFCDDNADEKKGWLGLFIRR